MTLSLVDQRPPETPTAADRNPVLVRAALETHLEARGASPPPVRSAAMTLYEFTDDEIVPLAEGAGGARGACRDLRRCRRALPARQRKLHRGAGRVHRLQEIPGDADLAARVTYDDGGRRILSIRPDLEAAPFQLLMPLLAHEAIHCDRLDSLEEEVVASAVDVYLYIHLLLSQPELARDTSPLARNFNIEALAMLNSGRAVPGSLGILESPHGREVLPESGVSHRSFVEVIAASYVDTADPTAPVEPVAQQYLDALAQAVEVPLGSPLDLAYVDSLLARATSFDAISNLLDVFDLVPG